MPKRDETWMWERARALIDQADRLHRSFFQLGRPGAGRPCWEPPVDIFETTGELWIVVALPGVGLEDVAVAAEAGTLVVRGERSQHEACRRAVEVHRLELPHGTFERRIDLPVPCGEIFLTDLSDGCLVLGLKKKS